MAKRDAFVPDPLVTDTEYRRFFHLDLCQLEDDELMDELHYLRPLLWRLSAQHWLRERVQMLEGELKKRRAATSYESSRRPKSKPAEGVTL